MRWQIQSGLFRRTIGKQDCQEQDDNLFWEYDEDNAGKSIAPVQSVYRHKPHKVWETRVRSGKKKLEFSLQAHG